MGCNESFALNFLACSFKNPYACYFFQWEMVQFHIASLF